jgi:hypothetical protein
LQQLAQVLLLQRDPVAEYKQLQNHHQQTHRNTAADEQLQQSKT